MPSDIHNSQALSKAEQENNKASKSSEHTVIKALALGGVLGGGGPCAVDVRDGKIVRVRPLHYDWKYDKEYFNPWKFERNGKTLEPLMKPCIRSIFSGL